MEVSVRDLKDHLSQYLVRAQAGENIVVTSHRRAVARLSGIPEGAGGGVNALLVSGRAEWKGGKPGGGGQRPAMAGKTLAEMVLEDRG